MKKFLRKFAIIAICLLLLAIIAYKLDIKEKILKKIYPMEYAEYVEKYSKEYGVDPLLIFSIIKAESNFDADAKSSSNAIGLMQLMEPTAREIDEQMMKSRENGEELNLYDPEINIMYGTNYYSYLLQYFEGNMLLALTAYNAGIGNVNNWIEQGIIRQDGSNIENIPYKETNMYVRKIINNYKIYQELYS